ncbi:amidohydrolase family protein [Streptomyces sp. SYSU K21746]
MLTIHAAPLVLPVGAAQVPDGAVVVDGSRIAAIGPYEELAATHPDARVRRWPGVLTPGLRQWHGTWLLTRCYHPDPREYAELGELPLSGKALERLELDGARWAGSVRRGLQRMLRHGTTALAVLRDDPAVRTAVQRSGLTVVSAAGGPGSMLLDGPDLDPFVEGHDLAGSVHAPLAVGARADLAAFDVPDEVALRAAGAASCVATVLDGRLVYRAR